MDKYSHTHQPAPGVILIIRYSSVHTVANLMGRTTWTRVLVGKTGDTTDICEVGPPDGSPDHSPPIQDSRLHNLYRRECLPKAPYFLQLERQGSRRMIISFVVATLLWCSAPLVNGLSPAFLPCQVQKPAGVSPLSGCPDGTIYVNQNTSDRFAHFHKIQDAILSLYGLGIPECRYEIVH
jgi:hypothetical protein